MEEFEIRNGRLLQYNEIEGKINIVIHENVTEIEHLSFSNCKNLKSIIIPNSIRKISFDAFENCISLTNINLPDGIKLDFNLSIFKNCPNLINVKASEETFKQLNYDDRYLIISNFARQYYTNNIYNEDEIDRYKRFILLTIKKELCSFIKNYYNISECEKNKGMMVCTISIY